MAVTVDSIQQAREAGYNDAEIADHLSKADDRFKNAFTAGYTLPEVERHLGHLETQARVNVPKEVENPSIPKETQESKEFFSNTKKPEQTNPNDIEGSSRINQEKSNLELMNQRSDRDKTSEGIAKGIQDTPILSEDQISVALKHLNPGMQLMEATNPDHPTVKVYNAGLGELSKIISGQTTAPNLAILGAAGSGVVAEKLIGGVFAVQAAKQLPEQWKQFNEEKDPEKKTEKAVDIIAGLAMAGAFLGHGAMDALKTEKLSTDAQSVGLKKTAESIKQTQENPATPDENKTTPQQQGASKIEAIKPEDKTTGEETSNQVQRVASTAIKTEDAIHIGEEPTSSHADITTSKAKEGTDVTEGEKGFTDGEGNFIDRKQAAKIALDSGQIDRPTYDNAMARDAIKEAGLHSEDLKPYTGGPGAMGPVEAAEQASAQKQASIKNASVDAARVARGLQPTMAPARQAFGEVWDRTMDKIERDPHYPRQIVDDIVSGKKTEASAEDQAALLHERITLQNDREQESIRALDENADEGDRQEARIRFAAIEDQLNKTDEATRKIGTIAGRALQIRQQMVNDDYTPAAMERRLRVAKGGESLTPEETTKIKQQSDRILELERQLSDRQNTGKNRGSNQAGDEAVKNLNTEAKQTSKKGRDINKDRESTIEKLKSRLANGEKIQDMAGLVQKLALHFVEQGIKERQPLVEAVHDVLKTIVPDITPRETMDAISGYGDFKQLSKDEMKVQLRDLKGQMQQAAKIEDMQEKIPPKKTGVERRIPSDIERRMIKEVNELKKKGGFNVTDPETQLKSALQAFKTRTENRIKDLQLKVDQGDFSKTPRRELKLDDEALKLKADSERAKLAFDRGAKLEQLKSRTPTEKVLDAIPKWSRTFLLSNPVTLAKLTMAALYRVASTPVEEAIGAGYSKIIPGIAERAPREGGGSVKIESKALVDGLTKGFKDAYDVMTKGKSDLEAAYGKRDILPPSPVVDFFGHLHGALKSPVKRIEFSRSLQKRMENAMVHGVDVTDPFVQTKLSMEAYKDANRSIFMQDNRVVSAYKAGLATLERPDKETGKTGLSAKATVAAVRTLLPIVKVPTNIVAETLQYATGTVTGSVRLAKALHDGVTNLKPAEADLIMRELKKGSLGGAVLLLGFFAPKVIGGYYQYGQKQKEGDTKYGHVNIYGNDIKPYELHAPVMEQLQLGATVRKVAESKLRKKDQQTQGIPTGILAGALGLTSELPFIREQLELGKLFNPEQRKEYIGELAKSRLVPQAVQWVAQHMDTDSKGDTVKRDPQNALQYIEEGIPGLRNDVPEKKEKGFSIKGRRKK